MKKIRNSIIIVLLLGLLIAVLVFFIQKNKTEVVQYETEQPFRTSIVIESVATGKVNPEEEVEVKPQITGIVDEILVEEGDVVKKGDLIAKIRVVPNAQQLAQANNQVKLAEYRFQNAEYLYERNQQLYENKAISLQNFQNTELEYQQAKQNLFQAKRDYEITKKGFAKGAGNQDNTLILAQISGTILQIPLREGDQVIQANNFNAGTTIATIADMNKMIFEGSVDESEVRNLKEGKDIKVTLAAFGKKEFPAKLIFVAPKGVENDGAVQFTIKAEIVLEENTNIRAGYSANAIIELDKAENILAINESLLQFDKKESPYVEVAIGDNIFERRNIKLGLSDGIKVEVTSGLTKEDKIKVWNILEKKKNQPKGRKHRK